MDNPSKINFKNLLTKRQWILIGSFFIIFLLILLYTFYTGNTYPPNTNNRIEISDGMTLSKLSELLHQRNIIPSKINFKFSVFMLGGSSKIKAGRYTIPNGLNYIQLAQYFLQGKGDILKEVKVYDGLKITQLAYKFRLELDVDSLAFLNYCKSQNLLDSIGVQSVEGLFLPGIYKFYQHSSPSELFGIMHNSLNNYLDSLGAGVLPQYSRYQKLIMASIVQGETNKADEMPIVASVYYNRMKKGMRLQADPTVQYLLPKWRRLYNSDLKMDSPYNTYLHSGLPPTPINNPGRAAIKAAFNPAETQYIFFVANGKGYHNFSENYNQHIKFVKEYRKWQDSQ